MACDFDGHGNVLFTRPNPSQRGSSDVIALGEPINGPRPATGYSVPFALDALQSDGTVAGPCSPGWTTWSASRTASPARSTVATARRQPTTVECLQASTGKPVNDTGNNNANPGLALAPPTPGQTAGAFGAVRTYLSPNDVGSFCGPAWSFFSFPGAGFVPQLQGDPARRDRLHGADGQPAAPVVDGSFALGLTMDCSGGAGSSATRSCMSPRAATSPAAIWPRPA